MCIVSISIVPLTKVSFKLCASSAKLPTVARLIYCYSASLPRTDLCLHHCLSLAQNPNADTQARTHARTHAHIHTHTRSCFFLAFAGFYFGIFFLSFLREAGVNMSRTLFTERNTPNWQHGFLFLMRFALMMLAWIYSWVTQRREETGASAPNEKEGNNGYEGQQTKQIKGAMCMCGEGIVIKRKKSSLADFLKFLCLLKQTPSIFTNSINWNITNWP